MKHDQKISLILSTYNWPEALSLVLESIAKQICLPHEVIVADDGSTDETKQLLADMKKSFPVPLIHSWQEDQGFRLAASKNKAIAKSTGDFLVALDGDLVLHPKFVDDCHFWMEENCFFYTTRSFLSSEISISFLQTRTLPRNLFWRAGVDNRKNLINARWLSKFLSPLRTTYYPRSVRGGLMGIWRKMLVAVNGFNEDFAGWGREDSELYVRLYNSGYHRRDVKLAANTYHLYHSLLERDELQSNDDKLQQAVDEERTWCDNGLNQYLG